MVAGARDRPAAAAVVDEGVARLLEHPLLVADDDLGRAELQEPLEAVVAVDDAAVEVVQVGGREAAAVELDHRPQVGRDDRQDREDHPLRPGAGAAEGLDQAEALDGLLAALAGARPDLDVEGPREGLQVHPADDLADRLGAHAGGEQAALAGLVELLVEAAELGLADGQHRLDRLELVAELAQLVLEALGLLLELVLLGRDRLVHGGLEVGDLLLDRELLVALALLDLLVDPLGLGADDGAELGRGGLAALLARGDDDLARRLEDDRLLGLAGLELGEPGLDGLGRGDDLLGARGALGLELGLGLLELGRPLVAVALDVRLELELDVGQALARTHRRGRRPLPRCSPRSACGLPRRRP